jgi:hypothetical protein
MTEIMCMNHPAGPADPAVAETGPPQCTACARSAGLLDVDQQPTEEATRGAPRRFRIPTITIPFSDGTSCELPAEATDVPGLYVTPEVFFGHLAADVPLPLWRPAWKLTHGPSGVALPYRGPTPEHVRELARALAVVRDDWSDLPSDTTEWPDGLAEEINRVGALWEMRRHRRKWPTFFWPVPGAGMPA